MQKKHRIKKARKIKFLRNVGAAVLSTLLVVAMLVGLFPGNVTQAAPSAVADTATADNWAKLNYNTDEGRTTKNDGRIWTDKSVYTGNASVLKNQSDNIEITKSGDSDFLVGLSALSSTMSVEGVSERPLDIIMVLDVSGSMNEGMEYEKVYSGDMSSNGTYYILSDNEYQELSYSYNSRSWYYEENNRTVWVTPKTSENDTSTRREQVYKIKVTKMEVLAEAVNNFIDTTQETNEKVVSANKQHRVSIVKFSGNISDETGNTTYVYNRNTYNHSQVVKEFTTPSNDATAKSLKDAVESLAPAGATRADNGLEVAEGLMEDVRSNAQPVVIFFTDGIPTTLNTWDAGVANNAIDSAKNMKTDGAWIYSVGVFDETDLANNNYLENYMQAVSSNYPNATGYTTQTMGNKSNEGDYYSIADDADELKAIFDSIAQEISGKPAEYPTHVDMGYDAEKEGYITFVDQLGDYMEVISVNSVVFEGVEYKNLLTDEAWENAESTTDVFVNDQDKVTNDLGNEVSIGAVEVRITRSADARKGDIITVQVPAALVPLAYYKVDVNDEGAITERIPTTPIRTFYEVGLKDGVEDLLANPDADMADYLATHTDANGQALFYSNAYDKDANAEIGSTVASFVPSKMNDMYYAVDDTLIFADEDCTVPVKRINESATYYYQRVYYVESTTRVAPKYELVAFPASVLRNLEYDFTDDGQLYVKAGTGRYTRADATDTVKADGANKTNTATKAAAPRWEDWNVDGSDVPVYLGNNGLLRRDIPGTLAISKEVVMPSWNTMNVENTEFSFEITLKDGNKALEGTFKAQLKDADGNNVGDAFNVVTDNEGNATVTLKDGQTVYIYGLPEGTAYTVEETRSPKGFQQTAPTDDSGQPISAEGTISAGKTSEAAFENTYSATGTLKGETKLGGTKKLTGRKWYATDKFAFALIPENVNNPMPEGAELVDGINMSLVTVQGEEGQSEAVLESFNFGDITYTEPGTYLYDIREIVVEETADRVPGISYSQVVYEVTVNVDDNEDGTLEVTSTMKPFGSNGNVESAAFENEYVKDTVNFAFRGIKELIDTTDTLTLTDDAFTFKLTPVTEGAPMPADTEDGVAIVTNKGVTVNFGTIECEFGEDAFTNVEDGVIVYEYVVEEVKPDNPIPGMKYDSNEQKIQVELSWSDKDGLVFNIVYPDADNNSNTKETWVNFVNTYDPTDATVALEGIKYLKGRDWKEGETFNFVLTGLDNAPMPEAANGESTYEFTVAGTNKELNIGIFEQEITFDKPGTYKYTLSEVAGNAGGMTYDDHVSNITVEVEIENGELKADINVEKRTDINVNAQNDKVSVFVNEYEAEMTYPGLTVEKTLRGRDMSFGEFDFRIEAVSEEAKDKDLAETDAEFESGAHPDGETCVNDGKLSSLKFTHADVDKEFVYKINEVLPSDDDTKHVGIQSNGVTFDETEYWVIILPEDNGDGTMDASTKIYKDADRTDLVGEWKTDREGTPTVSFNNEYGFEDVTVDTKANAFITKVFEGRKWLTSDTFAFKMKVAEGSAEDTPMPADTENDVVTVTVGKPADDSNKAVVDLGSITFTKEGTYKYEINEVEEDLPNVTYDTHTAVLTITVTDNGQGKLVASTMVEGSTFTNTYSDEVTYGDITSLDVTKSLEGRELRERQFIFQVVPKDIPSMNKAGMSTLEGITFRNGAPGEDGISHMFSPDAMTFDQEDLGITYSYIFSETDRGEKGYTYDSNVYTLEMTATYVDGHIEVNTKVTDQDNTVIKDVTGYNGIDSKPVVTIAFENVYEADSTSVKAEGTKSMENRELVADEFEFVLAYAADAAKTPLATVTNNAEGEVVFAEQTYTLPMLNNLVNQGYATKAVDGMTDTYTINYIAFEKAGDSQSITHTESMFAFTVTVTDDGTGKLTSEVSYPESTLSFKNEYKSAPVHYNVKGLKVLKSEDGLTPASIEGKFEFELKAVTEGAPMPEKTKVTNDASGNVDFGAIEFNLSDLEGVVQEGKVRTKTFEYSVTETGSAPGVINDSVATKTFSITVTDDGEGKMIAVANPAEGPLFTFTNTYEAGNVTESITGTGNLIITKELDGRDMKAGEFKFELVEGVGEEEAVVAEGTNTADGTVKFETVTYDTPDTHTYIVREVKGEAGGVTYDSKNYQVKAEVTDNGKGKLEVEFAIVAEDLDAIEFNNTYKPAETTLTVALAKRLEGYELKAGDFKFQIAAVKEDAPMPEEKVVSNNADGSVNFGTITYKKAGTWEYTISEVMPEDDDTVLDGVQKDSITYDSTVHNMKVVVKDDGEGHLTAKATFDGKEEAPEFVNEYKAKPVNVVFSANKTLVGNANKEFTFQLYKTKADFAVNGGEKLDEVKVKSGEVAFESIKFEKSGEYFYSIVEDIPADADGIVYDRTQHNYIVNVKDVGDGYLRAYIEYVNEESEMNDNSADGETVEAPEANFTNATFDEVTEKEVYIAGDTTTNIDGKKVDAGSILTYFINYTNYTGEDVVVEIEDKIPEHTTYVENSASHNGVYASGSVKWNLPVKKGESVTVHFQVKVDETEVVVANKAVVNDGVNTYTTNEVKNHTIEEVVDKDVFSPEDIDVSIDGKKVYEGDELYYEVSFTNTSNDKVDITITDEIPEYTTYVDKSADNNGVYADGKLTWEMKEVAPWDTVTVGFKVKVDEAIEAVTIENQAKVVEGKNTYKTDKVTNYTVEDEVEKDVALAEKPRRSIDGKKVNVGDELLYTISYKNTAKEAVNVKITDSIPEYTTYVAGSADNYGIYKDGVITWEAEVAEGETITVSFKVKVDKEFAKTIENEATIVEGKNTYTTNTVTNTIEKAPKVVDGEGSTKTGDKARIITYLFALLASLIAAFVALIVRRRNSYIH